jgi:hypothetical protein
MVVRKNLLDFLPGYRKNAFMKTNRLPIFEILRSFTQHEAGKPLAFAMAGILAASLAGCGGSKEASAPGGSSPAEPTAEPQAAPAAPQAAAPTAPAPPAAAKKISLPQGWAMKDAISAEEVGAITGETMTYFPEANSAAQNGKPSGSYTVAGKDKSKIAFRAVVGGGEKEFESVKKFAAAGTDVEVAGVGDKAYLCDFSTGATAIIVLKGEDVFRIDWFPETYASQDKAELGKKLAGKLIEKLYK